MARIGKKLAEANLQAGGNRATLRKVYRELVDSKRIDPSELSLREMAQSFIGDNWADTLRTYNSPDRSLLESSAAIGASGFAVIGGQLQVDEVLKAYDLASMQVDNLISTQPITNQNLGPTVIPGLGGAVINDDVQQEMEPAPFVQRNGRYITVPGPQRKKARAAITFEHVFADKTGEALGFSADVGEKMGIWRAERIYRVVYGITNNYKEAFTQTATPTAYNTYITSGTPWANKLTNFSLTDWTSIDTLEKLFSRMVDPFTGKRIMVKPNAFLVPRQLHYTAKRIFAATETRSGQITTNPANNFVAPNPLDQSYPCMYDLVAERVLETDGVTGSVVGNVNQARSLVTLGDFKKAFVWRFVPEFGPGVKVTEMPLNSEHMSAGIVSDCLVEVFGEACVRDPRYVVQAYDNSL